MDRRLLVVSGVLAWMAGCGDDAGTGGGGTGGGSTSVSTSTSKSASTTTSTSTSTSTSSSTSVSGSTSSSSGAGGADCAALIAAVDSSLEDAKACDPTIDIEQCTQTLDGPCCPVVVNPGNAAAVAAFQQAMADLADAHCEVMCPEIPCIENPVGTCLGSSPADGSCAELPPP